MTNLSKYLITAALACVVAIGATWGLLDRRYERNLNEIENSYDAEINKINAARDSLKVKTDSISAILAAYEAELDSLHKIDNKHRVEIDHLKVELKQALNWVFDALIDDNYIYLQERFPREDSLDYPFAGNQVKSIAMKIVEGDYKDSILDEQFALEQILRAELLTSSAMVSTLYKERDDFQYLTDRLYEQLAIKTKEGKLSDEEIARLKKALNKWRIGGLSLTALAAVVLILL